MAWRCWRSAWWCFADGARCGRRKRRLADSVRTLHCAVCCQLISGGDQSNGHLESVFMPPIDSMKKEALALAEASVTVDLLTRSSRSVLSAAGGQRAAAPSCGVARGAAESGAAESALSHRAAEAAVAALGAQPQSPAGHRIHHSSRAARADAGVAEAGHCAQPTGAGDQVLAAPPGSAVQLHRHAATARGRQAARQRDAAGLATAPSGRRYCRAGRRQSRCSTGRQADWSGAAGS